MDGVGNLETTSKTRLSRSEINFINRQEKNEAFSKNNGDKMTNCIPSQKADHVGSSQNKKSYASSLNGNRDSKVQKQVTVVKGNTLSDVPLTPYLSTPSLVLDDSCTLLTKEGFSNVKLTYLDRKEMGETMDIEENLVSSFAQKRLCLKTKQADNILEKFKVVFKGKENDHRGVDLNTKTDKVNSHLVYTKVINNSQKVHENVTSNGESAFNYSHNAHNAGSILEVLDDMIRSSSRLFNHFITSSRLVDVKLEGYSFTWAHPLATKMSKLDCFLVSEEFLLMVIGILIQRWLKMCSKIICNFFKQAAHGRLKLNISFPNRLSTYQVADMDRSVSWDEICVAVWNCRENKSPGLDGVSFLKGSNSSFIALILKVTDAKYVTDFRPISLIGCVYKVVTKILANRLATVISDLVSDIQSTFVATRQILDGPFILNELLAWCKRKKKQAMIFKVNFAKAYDLVCWDYLLDVLQAFGFGPNWCKWIRGTFCSAMALILVNGSPTSEFPLFLATSDGLFKCIQIQGSMAISYLFYADDAIFIREWSDSNLDNIVKFLKCFFLPSRLKINIQKSQVLGVGVPRNIVNQVASLTGCAVMQNPFRYLGVMVGDSMSRKLDWADTPLRIKFHRLFALETDKESTVASKLGSSLVDASFRRSVRDGVERQQGDDLNSISGSVTLSASKDIWIFDLNGDGVFRVKEVRTILDDIFLPSAADATRWVKYIPIKINVFAWRAWLDRFPTRSNLVCKGVVLDSSLCSLCGLVPEDIHHVLFQCHTAKLVFLGFAVGGIWTGTIYCPFHIGMLGFLLFGFHLGSS
uniref:RNA-directed DNA polymerase, eukaryota n=1 Tax=Tanacetum cinerariifolium TaxID=118510 RepID=A0A6L2J1P3_TANCI|nr:RNA-directed DNA polymerase, eukaryota [Tanacetum cinerariifolium]